jgi:hypothetical protein
MFYANIGAQYKVSNKSHPHGVELHHVHPRHPRPTGRDSYGKPTMMTLYQKTTSLSGPQWHLPTLLKCSSVELSSAEKSNSNASESYHTPMIRIIANAVRILLIQSNIFPPRGIRHLGSHCPKDIPCPQDVYARGIWAPPQVDGATQRVRPERIFQPDDV